jgi:hypothetical protein
MGGVHRFLKRQGELEKKPAGFLRSATKEHEKISIRISSKDRHCPLPINDKTEGFL